MSIRLIYFVIPFLLIFSLANSLSISSCSSGDDDWECEYGEECVCEISGTCTDGIVLVMNEDDDIICAPSVDDDEFEIDWDICETNDDEIKIYI